MGVIEYLHIAFEAGKPMTLLNDVVVLKDIGFEGDRYAKKIGTYSSYPGAGRHVTMMEVEVIEDIASALDIPFMPHDTRRNITTRGIRLNALVGRRIQISGVVLNVIRLCDPCVYLHELLGLPVLQPLAGRAGIRCDVVSGGAIRVGDTIEVLSS